MSTFPETFEEFVKEVSEVENIYSSNDFSYRSAYSLGTPKKKNSKCDILTAINYRAS